MNMATSTGLWPALLLLSLILEQFTRPVRTEGMARKYWTTELR